MALSCRICPVHIANPEISKSLRVDEKPIFFAFLQSGIARSTSLLFLLLVWSAVLSAQAVPRDTSIRTCGGSFSDGPGNYPPNMRLLVRFCPDSAGVGLRLFFNSLQIGAGDSLRIFDGPDTTAPVRMVLKNIELDSFSIQASVQNASGCLAFLFISDATGEARGWDVNLSCGALCQRVSIEVQGIEAERDSSDPSLIPLCRGEGISARVALAFPDNRVRYEQALSSTSISWMLNGKNERNGLTYSKIFDTPGSNSLWVLATDGAGCTTLQSVAEILVAPSPVFEPSARGLTPVLCVGDTLRLNAAIGIAGGPKWLNVFPGAVRRASGDTLRPPIQSLRWRYQPEMIFQLRDTAAALADTAGLRSYILQASDGLGCVSEYRLQMEVLPQGSPDCPNCLPEIPVLPDTAICEGDSLALQVGALSPGDSLFAYKSNPQYPIGYANHPPNVPYPALLPVKSLPFEVLDNPLAQIERVCVTLRTDWAEDITLALRAPSGEQMELSSGNGGGLDDYSHTCFSPGASLPVTRGDAPFNGIFAPEGDWKELQGARVAGEWALLVSDGFDSLQYGYLEEWSIVFKGENELAYSWSPSEGLSCTSCDEVIIKPLQSTNYVLKYFDKKGCTQTDTLRVDLRKALPAPEPECSFSRTGQAVFSWGAIPDAVAYKLFFQINGEDTSLILPAPDTFFLPPDFYASGDALRLVVEAVPDSNALSCGVRTGVVGCIYEPCTIAAFVKQKQDALCFGGNSGAALVSAAGGFPPYAYQLNGSGTLSADGVFDNLAAGAYSAIAIDQNNCADTIFFDIGEAAAIGARIQVKSPIRCFGEKNGALLATAGNTSRRLRFEWSSGALGDSLSNLGPGKYVLTASDSLGCTSTDTLSLLEPQPLNAVLQMAAPSCFDKADGRISAQVSGGDGSYRYAWSTGTGQDTLGRLGAGYYCVTVSDGAGCQTKACAELAAPSALRIDSFSITPVDCNGRRSGEVWAYANGGTIPYRYSWSDPLGQVGPLATMLAGGPVVLSIQDSKGCLLKDTVVVPEPDALSVNLLAKEVSCYGGADGGVSATPLGGTAPYAYSWNNRTETSSFIDKLASGQYSVSVTDKKGCRVFAQAVVREPEEPIRVEILQTESGCYGEQKNKVKAVARGGTGPEYFFQWAHGATAAELSGLDSIRYALTVTDIKGCTASAAIQLKDLPEMEPNLIVNTPNCFGGSNGRIGINFVKGRPSADFSRYVFKWSNGATGIAIANLRGDQEYTVTVTDPQGCQAMTSRFLRQPIPIQPTLEKTDATCFGGSDGKAWVASVRAESKVFTYRWELPLTSVAGQSVSGLSQGTYRVIVTDEFGCFGEGKITIAHPPQLSAAIALGNNRCFGDATGSIQVQPEGGVGPYKIAWNDGGTGFARNNLLAGTYQLTLTDSKNCVALAQPELIPSSKLAIGLSTVQTSCFGANDGRIDIAASGGKAPYSYSLNGKDFKLVPALIGLAAGNYDVYVRDGNGCQSFERVAVKSPPAFVVDAGPDSYRIKLGDTLALKASATGAQGRVAFTWAEPYPGTLSCTSCATPLSFPQNTISYQLNGIDSAGCEASDRVTVNIAKERDILVPTGFSPNGDGANDLLLVHGLNGTRILVFQVFDRWGQLVYEAKDFFTNDAGTGWDGTFRGQPLSPGLFVWLLEAEYIDGYKESRRGQTTLLR